MNRTSVLNKTVSVLGVVLSIGSLCYFVVEMFKKWDEVLLALGTIGHNVPLIVTEVALCAVGFAIEAMRWGTIMHGHTSASNLRNDLLTVLRASAYASATPGGVGEHAARVEDEIDKKDGLSASVMASALQTACISVLGVLGSMAMWMGDASQVEPLAGAIRVVVAIMVAMLMVAAMVMLTVGRVRRFLLGHVAMVGVASLMRAAVLNVLRVVCFSFQLSLLLKVGEWPSLEVVELVFVYYMLLTFTPRIAWLDLGLKGSLGILVFGRLMPSDVISASVVVLWVVNIVCPALAYYVWWIMGRHVRKEL